MIDNPNFPEATIKTRKIAVLLADGFDDEHLLPAVAPGQVVTPRSAPPAKTTASSAVSSCAARAVASTRS